MIRRTPEEPSRSSNRFETPVSKQDFKHLLLAAMAHSSTISFSVCDHRPHFQGGERSLGNDAGVASEAHFGAKIRAVLGPERFELAFQRVLKSGIPYKATLQASTCDVTDGKC
jgi:hypothetical protein